MNIGFYRMSTSFDCTSEGSHGVFGPIKLCAAMSDCLWESP
jgi:hypothetical protein